ncbi:hypothetical protein CHS0354_007488 [Potamilus streckersoni]|uniref:Uncharacterized protein n=1 Tax=Potamilus streckersoni TaxID=2493646 RepID=A0AAE0W7X8_9BIVA|nr:hypothetical protein CHS0354_007488 [Potamilus streckersoni]
MGDSQEIIYPWVNVYGYHTSRVSKSNVKTMHSERTHPPPTTKMMVLTISILHNNSQTEESLCFALNQRLNKHLRLSV